MEKIEIKASDKGGPVQNDQIILNGEDISKMVTGYEIIAHHGDQRKIIVHLMSMDHETELVSEGEITMKLWVGGKTYRLVEETDESD